MPSSASLVRVRDLSVAYAGAVHPAPQSVSFDIRAGEVVLLRGPSGSGKSTLALALNGLIPQSIAADISGSIEIDGRDTQSTPVAQLSRDVAMVFQDPDAQLVTGTVLDEVAFALENLRLSVDEILSRCEESLRRVGLWERRDWNPDHLSGGGRQRLAIACALAMRSRVIVLDEPTANLDPEGVADVHSALRDLASDAEHAVILIEHNLEAALSIATRVIELDQGGRLIADGPAERHPIPAPAPRRPASDAAPSMVAIRDLVVTKGRMPVLTVPALDIAAGSFTAIVGPNGAGKTTLLQAIAGVVPPPRGAVVVDGIDVGTAAPRELAARIGFVFQNPEHQFIAPTVRDELAHGLRLQRRPPEEITARVDEMLTRFDLAHKAETHPFLLSGGEKRRLSVGTAMITRPQVLALDEPTFGQDPDRARELLALLRELQDEGITIIVVTHDPALVAAHATHVISLHPTAVPVQVALSVVEATPQRQKVRPERRDDAYQERVGTGWLGRINPLAKAGAVVPAMAVLVFARDLLTPTLILGLSYLLILTGARLTRRSALLLFAGIPVGIAVLAFGFAIWVDPAQTAGSAVVWRIGDWSLRTGALAIGLATGLRLAAILALALISGLTTTGPELVRSAVQHLHVPYRVGYAALASYRFVPRFGYELGIIRAAHRVRGHHGGRGPFARLARGWGYIVPLLAGAIRHAERVALSMDARAFGAYPTRTERHPVPWRLHDTIFTAALIAACAVIFTVTFPWRLG